ncbi:MAG: hypothetical protein ACNA8S_00830 [Deferrisomatales bacterium]
MSAPSPVQRWKPAARARTQVLLAAVLWTGVGGGLAAAGIRWSLLAPALWPAAILAVALPLGLLKGRLALDRTAARIASRIARRGDGTCLGGFLSWKTWLFVLAMVGLGGTLRGSDLPRAVLGLLYTAVGISMLWGSRVFWAEWRSAR